jgi:hypothetical protein
LTGYRRRRCEMKMDTDEVGQDTGGEDVRGRWIQMRFDRIQEEKK